MLRCTYAPAMQSLRLRLHGRLLPMPANYTCPRAGTWVRGLQTSAYALRQQAAAHAQKLHQRQQIQQARASSGALWEALALTLGRAARCSTRSA